MKSNPAATAIPMDASTPSPAAAKAGAGGKKLYASTKKIQTVTENLGLRIRNGEWKGEERLPPQSHLAREYGVSQGAIAIAMRALQKEGLLHLVPGKGAFVPEQDAARTKPVYPTIGIRGSYVSPRTTPFCFIDNHDDPRLIGSYSASVLQAVWSIAQQEECPLLLLPNSGTKLTRQSCQALGVQGVLFLGGESYAEALELRLSGFPVMTANPPSGPTPMNYVNHDHAACLVNAIQQFIDVGHQRIAVLFPTTSTPGSFQQLKPCFIETLCAAGILYNFEKYWRFVPHDRHELNFEAHRFNFTSAVEELLDLPEPPTAILCLAGFYVPFVYQTLHKRGLSVPRDISLLSAPFKPGIQPATSGYALQFESMARELLHGIHETIRNPFYSVQKLIPFHPLTDCGTVAPPPPR